MFLLYPIGKSSFRAFKTPPFASKLPIVHEQQQKAESAEDGDKETGDEEIIARHVVRACVEAILGKPLSPPTHGSDVRRVGF